MAVKIRLKRLGKKKQPFYRIVVADSRAPRDGRSIEKLGYYNPIREPAELVINEERLFHWMNDGATPSDTVFSLLRSRGLTLKFELVSRGADEATISKEMQKWELAQDERQKRTAEAATAKKANAEAEKEAAETVDETPVEAVPAEEAVEEAAPAEETAEEAAPEEETPAEKVAEEAAPEEEVPAKEEAEAPAEETPETAEETEKKDS
ncbi:MAG: 30S ribosomal protein S16 [Candidatus Marinimicrobia bacterium]|nr:30S ribosomal protein S16 [Candidatus Neomarinimicrobiota bacterium]MCF7851178.1 30S ribosomal protein S16 [Candidatus Neomarinimicrobiota bacterium]MCF7904239.1 30S ribosomal protein S16 [Candidatus Neomarinimicrobiota bacterium]